MRKPTTAKAELHEALVVEKNARVREAMRSRDGTSLDQLSADLQDRALNFGRVFQRRVRKTVRAF